MSNFTKVEYKENFWNKEPIKYVKGALPLNKKNTKQKR